MKRICLLMGVVVMVLVSSYVCFAATRNASMQVSSKPVIATIIGTSPETLDPGRYPQILSRVGSAINDYCWQEALVAINNQRKTGAGFWTGQGAIPKELFRPVPMDGNNPADGGNNVITIPDRNRGDSKILISWTLDIMAADTNDQQGPVPLLQSAALPDCPTVAQCTSTPGGCNVTEYLQGGHVYVQAFVNNEKWGDQLNYSLPGGITIANWSIPYIPPRRCDPTCSGSFMLDKSDFGGTFPRQLKIRLGWYNDSAVKVLAPAKRRVINVLIEPVS